VSRLIAWTAFLLGIGASVAANVAHARPEIGPRLASAFAPLALVLAVELAVRLQWRPGWRWMLGRWGGTGLVAVVTAVVSYRHQVGLLAGYGEDPISAAILPLSVDGLMLTSAAALLALSGRPEPVTEPPTEQVSVTASAEVTADAAPASGPVGEQTTEPAPSPARKRPARRSARADADLLTLLRPLHAVQPLTRHKVQKLTDVSARQAARLVAALASGEREQAEQITAVNGRGADA
jgi:hypothetical protein